MTAAAGGYRMAIVDGAESMNRNAANALLKTLEEPPARSVLILISHRPGSLAATIRSRCAKLRLSPLPDAVVADALARWMPDLKPEERRAHAAGARQHRARRRHGRRRPARVVPAPDRRAGCRSADHRPGRLSGELTRTVDGASLTGVVALIQELLGRVIAAGLGRLGPALFPDEESQLAVWRRAVP